MPYKISANVKRGAMSETVTFSVNLPIAVKKEGAVYSSWCPILDVSAFGKTREEARAMLSEAVRLFIVDCYRRGTLERVLKDSGFLKSVQSAKAPARGDVKNQISVRLPGALNLQLAQCLA